MPRLYHGTLLRDLRPDSLMARSFFFFFFFFFFYSEKRRLNSPRANKRAQIKLQNNTEYYGLRRMSLRVDFRNDKDWVSLGAGGRVFHREMADGKKEFWKDEVLEGGQRKLLG